MRYRYADKECNPTLLYRELLVAFPMLERQIDTASGPRRTSDCAILIHPDGLPGIVVAVPDSIDSALLDVVVTAHDPQAMTAEQEEDALRREALRAEASSLEGRRLADLTLAEQRTLLGLVLRRLGVIASDGTVLPPDGWRQP